MCIRRLPGIGPRGSQKCFGSCFQDPPAVPFHLILILPAGDPGGKQLTLSCIRALLLGHKAPVSGINYSDAGITSIVLAGAFLFPTPLPGRVGPVAWVIELRDMDDAPPRR